MKSLQSSEILINFATVMRKSSAYIHVSIVQWIEYRIPVPTIRVRLPMEILRQERR